MKKILLTLAIALIASSASAQIISRVKESVHGPWNESAQCHNFWSMRAGVNFGDLVQDHFETDALTGFNVAGLYNFSLMKSAPLYLQSGVAIEMNGAKNMSLLGEDVKSHFKSYNLEIPIVVTYDIMLGKHTAIVPEVGIFYSVAFTGSLESDDDFARPYKDKIVTLEDEQEQVEQSNLFHRSDFGIRAGLSFRYSRYLVGFAYDAGLVNAFAKDLRDNDMKCTTGCWSINLGCRFN